MSAPKKMTAVGYGGSWVPDRQDNAEIVVRGESRKVADLTDAQIGRAFAFIRRHDGATIRSRSQLAEFCAKWYVNHESVYDAGSL